MEEYLKQIKDIDSYRLGIELECVIPPEGYEVFKRSSDYIYNNKSLFIFGSDGSIASEGKGLPHEIKAMQPLSFQQIIPAIIELSEKARTAQVFVNASCGYHLHASNEKFFDATYLQRIIETWVAIEDVLVSTQPVARMNNKYCLRYLHEYLKMKYVNFSFSKNKSKLINQFANTPRGNVFNLASLYKHGSIEIRLHAGTTNGEKIVNWIRLMLAIFDYSINSYNAKNIKKLFKTELSEEKIDAVFKELNLPADLADFYKARIEKHLFKSLNLHNKTAIDNLNLLLKLNKEKKAVKTEQNIISKEQAQLDKKHALISKKQDSINLYQNKWDQAIATIVSTQIIQ